jgi:transcriptional regulator with XRE-family HTH domain
MTDYPHAETVAAKMLARGLRTAAAERKLSLRQIGRQLGYNQPVVLSHMATGRVPIPIDRAVEIAEAVGMPPEAFLDAVLVQRHPGIDWRLIKGRSDPLCDELASLAGKALSDLSKGRQQVLRDAASDADAEERWLSEAELPVVRLLRELFPHMKKSGLAAADRETLRVVANLLNEQDRADRDGE